MEIDPHGMATLTDTEELLLGCVSPVDVHTLDIEGQLTRIQEEWQELHRRYADEIDITPSERAALVPAMSGNARRQEILRQMSQAVLNWRVFGSTQ